MEKPGCALATIDLCLVWEALSLYSSGNFTRELCFIKGALVECFQSPQMHTLNLNLPNMVALRGGAFG